jgi:hypothetical protein
MARAWLAAVLAFVYPGLGHVYLRAWVRAVAWFGLAVSTIAWLMLSGIIPQSAITAFERGGVQGILDASRALPTEAHVAVFLVTSFNVFDAYLTARRDTDTREDDGDSCPECGQELDDDIDFCPWCTTRLEEATSR